jgi:hypothetical protein
MVAAACSAVFLCSAEGADIPSAGGGEEAWREAYGKYVNYFTSDDPGKIALRLRAIVELGLVVDEDPAISLLLIDHLRRDDHFFFQILVLDALAHSRTLRASDVVETFGREAGGPQRNLEYALAVLGRMQLARENLPLRLKGEVRVALAAIGYKDTGNIKVITEALADKTEMSEGVLRMMALTSADKWADEDIIRLVGTYLVPDDGQMSDRQFDAVSALARLGSKAAAAARRVNKHVKAMEKEEDGAQWYNERVAYGSGRRREHLENALPLIERGWDHTMGAVLLSAAGQMSPETAEAIIGMLQKQEDTVVIGALKTLGLQPFSARHAAPAILDILKSERSEDVRSEAAAVLSLLGDMSLVPALKELLAKEPEVGSFVRDNMEETIATLTFDEEFVYH